MTTTITYLSERPRDARGDGARLPASVPWMAPGLADPVQAPRVDGGAGEGTWRDGDQLVVDRDAVLADTCLCCGAPAQHVRRVRLRWHARLWYLLLALAPIVYLVVAAIVRQRAWFALGLCDVHERHWRVRTAAGWTGIVAGLGVFIHAAVTPAWAPTELVGVTELSAGGVLAFFAGVIVLATRPRPKVARMDRSQIWFTEVPPSVVAGRPQLVGGAACELPRAWVANRRGHRLASEGRNRRCISSS